MGQTGIHVFVYIKGAVAIQVQKTDETEAVQLKKKNRDHTGVLTRDEDTYKDTRAE